MKQKDLDFFKVPEGVRIPYFGGRIYKGISAVKRKEIRKTNISGLQLNNSKRNEKIIVSLTTFPARIETVGYALISLFNQTMRPDRIILWLAKEQFPDFEPPALLAELMKKGLEIQFCEDLRSHKKYYYPLKNQKKDELVVTYDDDIIFPEDSIELLYKAHLKYPKCIICNRAEESQYRNGKFTPYTTWKVHSAGGVESPSMRLFPSTGGGVLYPYGSVNEEAYNIKNMKELAFTADDIWMRFMSALNGTSIIKTRKNNRTFTTIEASQTESLQVVNCLEGENDRVVERLSKAYPKAVDAIISG